MSRGGSYGGGQSSLGYLFESDESPSQPPVSGKNNEPPSDAKKDTQTSLAPKQTASNNYHRAQGQNTGNFITVSSPHKHIYQTCCTIPYVPWIYLCLHISLFFFLFFFSFFFPFLGTSYDKGEISTWRRFISWVLVWRQMTRIGSWTWRFGLGFHSVMWCVLGFSKIRVVAPMTMWVVWLATFVSEIWWCLL